MMHHLKLQNYTTISGVTQDIELSYELFGRDLHAAPIVLVNHALTGNSNVTGDDGWWSALIGEGKRIDTAQYTILSFNVPGNGHDKFIIDNYKDFVAGDVARIFFMGIRTIKDKKALCHYWRIIRWRYCLGDGCHEP